MSEDLVTRLLRYFNWALSGALTYLLYLFLLSSGDHSKVLGDLVSKMYDNMHWLEMSPLVLIVLFLFPVRSAKLRPFWTGAILLSFVAATSINVYRFDYHNDRTRGLIERRESFSLADLAKISRHKDVKTNRYSLISLRERLEGKKLLIPSEVVPYMRRFRYFSGATVEKYDLDFPIPSIQEFEEFLASNPTVYPFNQQIKLYMTNEHKASYVLYVQGEDYLIK